MSVAIGSASGCIGENGDKIERTSEFRAVDGSYGFDFPSPPWEVESLKADSVRLEIATAIFGYKPAADIPPSHVLIASRVNLEETLEEILDIDDLKSRIDGDSGPGGDTEGEGPQIPEYLVDVDITNPRDVAVAEANFLIADQDARIVDEIQHFTTNSGHRGVDYQLAVEPGIFVRSFYLATRKEVVRIGILSLFNLESSDIDYLMSGVFTDAPTQAP